MDNWRSKHEYRVWRREVLKRDKVCVICGNNKRRHVHHIHHSKFFEKLRFNINNGVCLCAGCHSQYHNNFVGNYTMSCDAYSFENFKCLMKYAKTLKR